MFCASVREAGVRRICAVIRHLFRLIFFDRVLWEDVCTGDVSSDVT